MFASSHGRMPARHNILMICKLVCPRISWIVNKCICSLFFYLNLWIVQISRCRRSCEIDFYWFIHLGRNDMTLCRSYVLKFRLWIYWCYVFNFDVVKGKNIMYGHCFQRSWCHQRILLQILWELPLTQVPRRWWLLRISLYWSVSWCIWCWGVVIVGYW